MHFTGGEVRHHKDCPFYPDSLSKKYDVLDEKLGSLLRTLGERYWNEGTCWANGHKKIHGTPTHWQPLPNPPKK
jgi:hypothetical protein